MNAIIGILATRRLTTLMVDDKITEDVRAAIFRRYPPHTHKLGYVFTCRKCSSVWAAAATLVLLSLSKGKPVASLLALSETVILTDQLIESRDTGFTL